MTCGDGADLIGFGRGFQAWDKARWGPVKSARSSANDTTFREFRLNVGAAVLERRSARSSGYRCHEDSAHAALTRLVRRLSSTSILSRVGARGTEGLSSISRDNECRHYSL